MFGLLQAMLILTIPILLGVGLIYLGARRGRNETSRLKAPTTWDFVNQAAGYWILGGLLLIGLIGGIVWWFNNKKKIVAPPPPIKKTPAHEIAFAKLE